MSIRRKILKGKIVLIYFPFTDLTHRKLRPALILYESKDDVVAAFISSRIEKYDPETDVLIKTSHPEFGITGLKMDYIIKLTKIATLHKRLIAGEIGEVGPLIRKEVNKKVVKILTL